MRPVNRSDGADEHLIAIWLDIADDNAVAADRVLDATEAHRQQLVKHPHSGLARDDIAPGIRHRVAGQYLTLYRILDDGIEIVRLLHPRRKVGRGSVGD